MSTDNDVVSPTVGVASADSLHEGDLPLIKTVSRSPRFLFIDGLRGIASLAVVFFHYFACTSPLKPIFQTKLWPIAPVCDHGDLGVQIFFVISGFVIAYSQRKDRVTPRFFGTFVVRRSLRLDPPYWATIIVTTALAWLSNQVLRDRFIPMPDGGTLLAHLFYVQDFFHIPQIVVAFWTLCMEVQFYLIYTTLRGLMQWGGPVDPKPIKLLAVFAPLAIWSVAVHSGLSSLSFYGFCISLWHLFFMGVMTCWMMTGLVRERWFWLMIVLVSAENLVRPDLHTNTGVVTAVAIYSAIKLGKMETWLSWRIVQFFGKISYSLYLLNQVTGYRVLTIGFRLTGYNTAAGVFWVALATAFSIGTAYLMYRFVEVPGMSLGKKLRFKSRDESDRARKTEIAPVIQS